MARSNRQRTSRRAVYETLRRKVLTLELPPGAALSENELAASLGVSRTPVRESLILLSHEGLVQVFPQVGSFVSRVDPAKVADAQFLREAVELASLDDLPAELDPELVESLRGNLAEQQRPGLALEEFFELDEAFHQTVLRLSGHGSAWATVVSAKGHLDRARRLGLYDTASPAGFATQHVEIFDAVLAGDVSLARTAMRTHLRAVFDDVERIRARSPELFATDSGTVPVRRNIAVWE
ncbi:MULTISPECIES: GntR family transcriptional regulator [unclassified Streptomyces]|uniref:GntR family transcriptional regulator n=1 Tax=unclassified Streptomyces TaxID=2593676 RepID=UPI0037F3BD6F